MKRIVFIVLFCFCIMQALMADDGEENEGDSAITSSNELLLQISSLPELKLRFTRRYNFPFLQGDGPLTEGNSIDLALGAEVSPVSLNGTVGAVWTPIAFFQLSAGGNISSGWNISLFGGDVYGIGLNRADAEGKSEHSGSAFDGIMLGGKMGAALQADMAAFFPGDWHHIVMRTYHEINGKMYSGAAEAESWYFENDGGENCNGFGYGGNLLLGYQMPIFLNMVALLAEWGMNLYNIPNHSRWGDDKPCWTFSAILGFTITEQFSAALITQFTTEKNYRESYGDDLYYRNRRIDNANPLRLEFYRVAAALTYRL